MLAFVVSLGLALPAQLPDASPPPTSYRVRLHLEPGRTAVYQAVMEKTVIAHASPDQPFRTLNGYTFELTPETLRGDRALVRMRFRRLVWKVQGGAAALDFDSARPAGAEEAEPLPALRRLLGKNFLVVMNDQGKVFEVRGLRELMAGTDADGKAPAARRLEDVVGPAQVEQLLRTAFAWIPSRAVAPGETWQREESLLQGVLSMSRRSTITFTDVSDDKWSFRSRLDLRPVAPPGARAAELKFLATIVPTRPGAAEMVFNSHTGLLERATAQIEFDLRIDALAPGRGKEKRTTQMQSLAAKTLIELVEVVDRVPVAN